MKRNFQVAKRMNFKSPLSSFFFFPWCSGYQAFQDHKGYRGFLVTLRRVYLPAKSAFAVKLSGPLPAPSQLIVFKEALHNHQDHFSLTTGVVTCTCTVPGVRRFGFDFALFQHAVRLGLMKNGTQVLEKEARAKDNCRHVSGNVALQLIMGDRVWLESKLDTAETEKGLIQRAFFGYLLYGNDTG